MPDRQRSIDLRELAHQASWTWPDDAADLLLPILRDRGAPDDDRLLAAAMAGDPVVVSDTVVEALLAVLRDTSESPLLRGRAAISFGPVLEELDIDFPDPFGDEPPISDASERAIRQTLHDIHRNSDEPKEVRRRTLEASVRMPEPWHLDAVRAAYDSGDDEWKLTAVFCMGFVRGFDDEIVEALESDADSAVFYEAVRAAGAFGVRRAWPRIRDILESDTDDRELLLVAIEAVPGVHPERAVEVLEPFLDHEDDEVAEAASMALTLAEGADPLDDDEEED